ncbi:hybrid sensor histidine kinase/response regulator [Sinomicrobium pectinilyticum]|uniref:histidine kinase n=1 Tax=Sinomicrobium pectinilyticum TaxID=1084421 RepID=A0A3N0E3I2_SINP1|nr:hybrid sensor histidine kinase/response regulator transcription factor [Sinomicrobium pectinilyticum]RNL82402.1 hybrid sensor histidine kinase/response regulator [Sinomicrobium pectinilyticum]
MRAFIKILGILVMGLMATIRTTGQSPYIFHHLTTGDGLSNSHVGAVLKDSYGFLWVGTASGLNRYDGYGFKTYTARPGEPGTMSANNIWGLQEDGLGNIWVRSFTYMVYNRDKDNFITDVPGFLQDLGISVDRNYKVYVDREKDLWVMSGQKVYLYDTRKEALKVFNIKIRVDEVVTVELSDNGNSLYGMLKPGFLWQMDKHTGRQRVLELQHIATPGLYNKIYADSHGGLWLLSGKTDLIYYRKSPDSDWEKLLLSSVSGARRNKILNMLDDENGRIWIGTDHDGLFIYDRATGALTNLSEDPAINSSIASDNIACLYKDDNGIIWIGHNKKGISYYHHSFRNIVNEEHPDCRNVSVILEDRQGNTWLGTDGNGLFLKEKTKENKIRKLPLQSDVIVSLLEDRKGRIWIGTYIDGLFCYENGKFSHFTKDNSALVSDDIWNLQEDRYGNLWIGTLGGGIQCLRNEEENMNALSTVCEQTKHPMDMYYDNGDKLYIGTVYGLYVVDITTGGHVVHTGNKRGTQHFNKMLISSVYKDSKDNIWLGHLEGLTLWDLKKDTLYFMDKDTGLTDNLIQGIIEDDHRNIWVTTSNGLSILSAERDSRDVMKISYRNFSSRDGFKDNHFNNNAIYKLRNGDILLGGVEGLTVVNPNKMAEKNRSPAQVIFTGLSVGNSSVKVDSLYKGNKLLKHPMEQTDSLTFRHNDKQITIQFTTGDLLHADKVKYAYKLEGFDTQWLYTQDHKIMFSSLAPGSYRLLVKAGNSDGVWNGEASVLNITVTPPFYLSGWAIALYAVLAIGLISFIVYRIRKHHRRKFEQQRIQLRRKQEASLNEMKLRFFTNISHDLRTPLTLITTPLQAILNQELEVGLRKKLNTINKNAEQLLTLINSLLDFRKLDTDAESLHLRQGNFVVFMEEVCAPFHAYAVDRHINFSFSGELKKLSMQFDPDKVQKIMLNLLSNAFKFTQEGGEIDVRVYWEEGHACVDVTDSGPGIGDTHKKHIFERFYQGPQLQERTGSGIGLHIVSEYVRMHGGTIAVKDNIPQGSTFTFTLPVTETGETEELSPEEVSVDDIAEQVEDMQGMPGCPVLLFVDDNKDLCEFMEDSLSDEYTVLLANNGREALAQLEKHDINVVVSDVMMPLMDGIELCNRIKTNIQWSHIPVILLTARTAEEYEIKGLEVGADDYLTKPFNFNLLKLRIRKFLEWTEKCHLSFSQKIDVSPGEITITPLDQQLIEKAIKVVEEHIADPEFSVEELGSEVGLSRSHLYKKLMSITGKGPAEFIRTIRLKRGRQLLEKSQMQIAEVAYSVGFNSPKRFTINFKNEFGISPSEYLRSIK